MYEVSKEIMGNYSSKAEKVYKILRKNIIERKLLPGQKLVERELIEKLGVSKTPVREALTKLKKDGLVEGNLRQSASVIRVSRKDVVEIYNLREVLEALAAKCAAEKITPEKAEELRSNIQLSEEYVKENNLKEYTRLDLKFHNLVEIISENKRLYEMAQYLRYQVKVLMTTSITLPGRGVKVSLSEHKKIVEAIINQNPNLAERMAKKHVRKTRKAVLDWFDRTQW